MGSLRDNIYSMKRIFTVALLFLICLLSFSAGCTDLTPTYTSEELNHELVSQINGYRDAYGVYPLTYSSQFDDVCKINSQRIVELDRDETVLPIPDIYSLPAYNMTTKVVRIGSLGSTVSEDAKSIINMILDDESPSGKDAWTNLASKNIDSISLDSVIDGNIVAVTMIFFEDSVDFDVNVDNFMIYYQPNGDYQPYATAEITNLGPYDVKSVVVKGDFKNPAGDIVATTEDTIDFLKVGETKVIAISANPENDTYVIGDYGVWVHVYSYIIVT